MQEAQLIRNLSVPDRPVDVVFDSDTYNEIDDQFAMAYLLKSGEKLRPQAFYAAPFHNERSTGPEDGMLKSYDEMLRMLALCEREELRPVTFLGSRAYLPDEKTPVDSPAARDLAARARHYTPEEPLYVVATGAITNVASALLLCPEIGERIVVVWLGGHAVHYRDTAEFNMMQDVAAARVVFSHAPVVQLPCVGVVDHFHFSLPELTFYLRGKGKLADYLLDITVEHAGGMQVCERRAHNKVIWDVTAVAWLLNDGNRFMDSRITPVHTPAYDHHYEEDFSRLMRYVYHIRTTPLATDLIRKITDGRTFGN